MLARFRRSLLLFAVLMLVVGMTGGSLGGVSPAVAAQDPATELTAESGQADYPRGEGVVIEGTVSGPDGTPITGAQIRVVLEAPDGTALGQPIETVTGSDGAYDLVFPAETTRSLEIDGSNDYSLTLAARVEVLSGAAQGLTKAVPVVVTQAPEALLLENLFVSSVGWVKPGETYPSRLIVRNLGPAASDVVVTAPPVDGMSFVSADPVGDDSGEATILGDGSLSWDLGDVPAGTVTEPVVRTLVVQSVSDTLDEDPQVVWKDLSTTATLVSDLGDVSVSSHGPKTVPPNGIYDSARFGDRPFPVVPVDYLDVKHIGDNSGDELTTIINDPENEGSTFNLFQEMSYGQLYPNGSVPSADIATATWDDFDLGSFHEADTEPPDCVDPNTVYDPELAGTPELPERIVEGFYQLPGSVEFYGTDDESVDPFPAAPIDSGCGATGKIVYDAAAVADPEIDYNDYDTDKDGVVDFFMLIFAGCGGNGPSQRGCDLPDYQRGNYDNIWPHSSNLESYFIDDETGLPGYMSDDRLTDLAGNLLFYTDSTYTVLTTDETDFPAFVRVGPYNVNPETSMEAASVISHEYGHSLGLPDFYAGTGGVNYYGTWNLMATDHSQHMDLIGRQQLGWVIPREIPQNADAFETSMVDSTTDTNTIVWRQPNGTEYTLSGPDVQNGDAWMAPLPGRILLDPDLIENGASPTHVYWSQSGNDFACVPGDSAHSLDIPLDVLSDVEPGTPVTLEINSYWDIEWDFDYGFVLATSDTGANYTSLASEEGYTFPASDNPNDVSCQDKFGNGLSGTSGAWEDGDGIPDRNEGAQTPGTEFIPMTFDLTEFAGESTGVRFAYFTDVGLARPGWFIDDITVTAGDEVIYSNDLEGGEGDGVVNGGCDESGAVLTGPCTDRWQYVEGGEVSSADHSYYVELRDRTGFDLDGNGESDRGPITWSPGLSLGYTDEFGGDGNRATFAKPNQTILDANPVPYGSTPDILDTIAPNLDDAAWLPASEPYSDFGEGHADNYLVVDANGDFQPWILAHDCLELDVTSMTGQGVGPENPPGDLEADVSFTRGDGCGSRDYGHGRDQNVGPTAVAQVKTTPVVIGEPVVFDGSMSSDDATPSDDLEYNWDFGDGATGEGREATHVFDTAGTYEVVLTVTDSEGATDTDTIELDVIEVVIESLAISPAEASLVPGATQQLIATATFTDDTTADVTGDANWSTADMGVATVDANGLVTAQSEGTAEITAQYGPETATAVITVSEDAEPPTTEPPPTTLPPPEEGQRFDDVPTDYLFYDDIAWLAEEGITFGCNPPENSLFCPRDSVTRGQMAAFLTRTFDLAASDADHFGDDEESVFEDDINRLAAEGITIGCNPPDNTAFCPNDNVTRAQMASFLARAYGLAASNGPDRFSDDDGIVYEADIESIAEAGITFGCNPPANTLYCPFDDVLREQMAAFLHRASEID
ncbi:MAG: PKD domain-containing protein [Acidimicrobiia bacterium]|nr:PKD domain-containing protein [Acidimicrobiia bacterium]